MAVWIVCIFVVAVLWWAFSRLKQEESTYKDLLKRDDLGEYQQRITIPSPAPRAIKSSMKPDYTIEYADVDGVITERPISIIEVQGAHNAVYLRAFCHLRQSERTFRADRIVNALKNGQAVADPEMHFFELIPAEERPDADHDAVMSRVRPGLEVLIWIANADRQISADEKEELLNFIGERNGLAGAKFAEIPWSKAKATRAIDAASPTLATATGHLARISRTGKEYAMIKQYADKVAAFGGQGGERRLKQLFK